MTVRYTDCTDVEIFEAAAVLRQLLQNSSFAVAFTGAGISTDSGIPDYRSPGGVWTRYRMVEFKEFQSSADGRLEYWRQKSAAHAEFAASKPNVTHNVLAAWEAAGKLHGVITQNIDGLHQEAGSQRVLELHGTARQIACLECSFRERADELVAGFLESGQIPDCPECGGLLKHATISFGQALPLDVLNEAVEWLQSADLMIALGSSLTVEPAASLPRLAAEHGIITVIVNREPTPLDEKADLVIHAPLASVFEPLNLPQER